MIIGAGPAGLTAAYELSRHGQIPTVLEADPARVGGLARTFEHRGFRFDLGGHRFFTKNREVEALWQTWLGPDLIRVPRRSRILYRGRLFDYPLRPFNAFRNLGLTETVRCLLSYLASQLAPPGPIVSFEDWVVRQFGRRLYEIFFKTYTEKVWGIPCHQISADWAVQRIQGLSLGGALRNAVGLGRGGLRTLTDWFWYPRLGPGMLWSRVAENLNVQLGQPVARIGWGEGPLRIRTPTQTLSADRILSSMPLPALMAALDPPPPDSVLQAARGLSYRDFLTVGLCLRRDRLFPDQWLYVHDRGILAGRVQNYGNWSREMAPKGWTSLGVEYFCHQGDALWSKSDQELIELAIREVAMLRLSPEEAMEDALVLRIPRAYPVYDPGYRDRVELVRDFLRAQLPQVQTIGRNGLHRYNNQDHAMLTGLVAARNLLGHPQRDPFQVNEESEYLEERRVPERLTE